MPEAKSARPLSFVLTEESFAVDDRGAQSEPAGWIGRFAEDRYRALYDFGFGAPPKDADAAGLYLHDVAGAFLNALANNPDLELARQNTRVELDDVTAARLLESVPFTLGSQYVKREWLKNIFRRLNQVFSREIAEFSGSVSAYLAEKSQTLRVKERIFFHLVERKDDRYPFAFLATYATKDDKGRVYHVPLQHALEEYRGNQPKLLELLSSLNRVCDVSPLLSAFVTSGEMFHPLRLTSDEAYQFLKDVPAIEEAGVICRIPNWWRRRSYRLRAAVKVSGQKKGFVGLDSILSARPVITVDGEPLTQKEIRELLAGSEGLTLIKGKWVEVNHDKLRALLHQLDDLGGDLTMLDALRISIGEPGDAEESPAILHNKWLGDLLAKLRDPGEIRSAAVPKDFQATLRPYQKTGYTWLDYMDQLKLGACLADDMGLGKTVQVLAYLDRMRLQNPEAKALLIVPASLLGNWEKEKEKFAPEISAHILHGRPAKTLASELEDSDAFLTVTTYGMAARIEELAEKNWDAIILDEAQAIKNPGTKQSKQIKKIQGKMRIALTGTPIENDLVNLWSLFDFLNKGLLGSLQEFKKYSAGLAEHPERYAQLRNMIAPFLLRRMKTDKSIISDLPEKLEEVDYVYLSKKQAALYEKTVDDVLAQLEETELEDGIRRSGIVLSSLVKLKQICNHPGQFLGQPISDWKESGKFEMLRELCETIRDNRERVLVFTQFREITPYLDEFLAEIFGSPGFVIHGGVPVKKRNEIVEAFQSERYYPYVVLSLKAGGTGLNLTNANHVVHFDRWWNPAVENQATDRAFRIGQKKNVMVHKLVSRGTIEEKIDEMIRSKQELAETVVGSGESWITKLSNDELASLMQLQR